MGRVALIIPQQDDGFRLTGVKEYLGVCYLAGALRAAGHETDIIHAELEDTSAEEAARLVLKYDPTLVGITVSIASLGYVKRVLDSISATGSSVHITVGGHLATFAADQFLALYPRIDSVCRGEGEHTIVNLTDALERSCAWNDLPGISSRTAEIPFHNSQRPAVNLDTLPWPVRDTLGKVLSRGGAAAAVTSRGCPRRCGYCSVNPFYQESGAVWRARSPEDVARELCFLQKQFQTSFVIFNDDNFFGPDAAARERVHRLAKSFHSAGVSVAFTISIRPEHATAELLIPLRDIGLRTVFLGLESGSRTGLRNLGRTGSERISRQAIKTLERLVIGYQIGFIMYHPMATLEEIRIDLTFLRSLIDDTHCLIDSYPFDRDYHVLPGTVMAAELQDRKMLYGDPLTPSFREYDKRTRILRNFSRKFIDPVFRPQFKETTTVLTTDEGRRRLRSLHLAHFDLLEQAASMIAADVSSQKLEHFGSELAAINAPCSY